MENAMKPGVVVELLSNANQRMVVVIAPLGQNDAPENFVWTAVMNEAKQMVCNLVPICALAPTSARH